MWYSKTEENYPKIAKENITEQVPIGEPLSLKPAGAQPVDPVVRWKSHYLRKLFTFPTGDFIWDSSFVVRDVRNLNPRTDGGTGHLSTDGGGADNRPPWDLENEAS